MLMQEKQLVACASRKLKVHEKNYPTHDMELDIVVFALETWKHYLYGSQFQVLNDHKSLKYSFDQKKLNIRQRHWMVYLKDYDFELLYHPGKANVIVDALRRKIVHMSTLMMKELELIEKLRDMNLEVQVGSDHIRCGMLKVTNEFLEEIRVEQRKDQDLQQIVGWLGTDKGKDYHMGKDGILRFRNKVCSMGTTTEKKDFGRTS